MLGKEPIIIDLYFFCRLPMLSICKQNNYVGHTLRQNLQYLFENYDLLQIFHFVVRDGGKLLLNKCYAAI